MATKTKLPSSVKLQTYHDLFGDMTDSTSAQEV